MTWYFWIPTVIVAAHAYLLFGWLTALVFCEWLPWFTCDTCRHTSDVTCPTMVAVFWPAVLPVGVGIYFGRAWFRVLDRGRLRVGARITARKLPKAKVVK